MKFTLVILASVSAVLAPSSFAQMVGLKGEISRFVNQIDEASAAVSDAMTSFTAEFSSSAGAVADREYSFTGNDRAQKQNPLAAVRYGYVDSISQGYFKAAGEDNKGMYALEATFKTSSVMPDISPILAGKTVLFVAHGPGPKFNTIYTTGTTSGTANLAEYKSMSRIVGFTCFLKSSRCTAATGSNPNKTCAGSGTINGGEAPGMVINNANNINLFYYVHGPFSLCADQYSLRNSMGS